MNSIDDSSAHRYPGGYQWVSLTAALAGVSESDRILTIGRPAGSYALESYKPPPNLFLIFSDTEETEDGIKRFADQYGELGFSNEREGSIPLILESSSEDSKEPVAVSIAGERHGALASGELFSAWQRQIQEMRQAVTLWSAVREAESGDSTGLSRHVRWLRKDFVYYDSHPHLPIPEAPTWLMGIPTGCTIHRGGGNQSDNDLRTFGVIASDKTNSEWLKFFRFGDCLMPAKYYLQRTVNEKLNGRVSPMLLWTLRRNRPRVLGLFFVPADLLGHMWLQLAEAINGNRQYRQCAACKTWILISQETVGNRSSRFTCSNACRMKVYYGRKVEARRLHHQGLRVEQIARRLDADKESVRRWIGVRRPKSQLAS